MPRHFTRALVLSIMLAGAQCAVGGTEAMRAGGEPKAFATEQAEGAPDADALSIPEPATVLLSCLGILGLLLRRRA